MTVWIEAGRDVPRHEAGLDLGRASQWLPTARLDYSGQRMRENAECVQDPASDLVERNIPELLIFLMYHILQDSRTVLGE